MSTTASIRLSASVLATTNIDRNLNQTTSKREQSAPVRNAQASSRHATGRFVSGSVVTGDVGTARVLTPRHPQCTRGGGEIQQRCRPGASCHAEAPEEDQFGAEDAGDGAQGVPAVQPPEGLPESRPLPADRTDEHRQRRAHRGGRHNEDGERRDKPDDVHQPGSRCDRRAGG